MAQEDLERRIKVNATGKDAGLEEIDLEMTLASSPNPNAPYERKASGFRSYAADTTISWLYWTPVMAAIESLSGLETDEILKSRLASICLGAFIARPQGMFRQYWANLWNADAGSSRVKKLAVDTSAQICFQVPLYSIILYFSGASLKEGIAALSTGVAIGALSARPFGYIQDKWRKLWGTKPTLDR